MKTDNTSESGIVLVLVLWVLTFLSVIVGEFCYSMRTEIQITLNFEEETQAYYISKAGIAWAVSELMKPRPILPYKPEKDEEDPGTDKIVWRINADLPEIPFKNGKFKIRVDNESGKIDINRAGRPLLSMILGNLEIEETDRQVIIDSILDWRDTDNLHRLYGAEDDYYRSLSEPYECKDGPFFSIGELSLVRGITPEIFRKLAGIVTVYNREVPVVSEKTKNRKKNEFDSNKININAAGPRMLKCLPNMDDSMVEEIIHFRKTRDFAFLKELIDIVGPETYGKMKPYITLELSPIYAITSVGMLEDGTMKKTIQMIVKKDRTLKNGYAVLKMKELGNERGYIQ